MAACNMGTNSKRLTRTMEEEPERKHVEQPAQDKGCWSVIEKRNGHHECEILGEGPDRETEECGYRWRNCKKNPEHKEFISVKDFNDKILPKVETDKERDRLRAAIDLTVRLRVNWASRGRPDHYPFPYLRGTERCRMGTGIIHIVEDPVSDKPCPCCDCNETKTRKFWKFWVRTAHHVVYNIEEAKATSVDLFFDDESCETDGRMSVVPGLGGVVIDSDRDACLMTCATHDEDVGERIKSAWKCWIEGFKEPLELPGLDFQPSCDEGSDPADPTRGACSSVGLVETVDLQHFSTLVVSHPHGQPKKITMGPGRRAEHPVVEYNTPTCSGSSGASVFRFYKHPQANWNEGMWFPIVHGGSFVKSSSPAAHRETLVDQLNYGSSWWWVL